MKKIEYLGKCLLIETENRKKILVIGDLHLGYEEILNDSGIFISRKMFQEMIEYLNKVFDKAGKADKIVLLGDVKHNFRGIVRQEWSDVLGLFDYLKKKINKDGEIIVIRGNHDNILEPITRKREGVILKDYYIVDDLCFLHGDKDFAENYDKKIKYWIVGHGHPAVKISDGVKVEKYKCFLTGEYKKKKIVMVPSFFAYSEGSDPRENDLGLPWNFNFDKFDVKVVGEELSVLDFGKLGKMK